MTKDHDATVGESYGASRNNSHFEKKSFHTGQSGRHHSSQMMLKSHSNSQVSSGDGSGHNNKTSSQIDTQKQSFRNMSSDGGSGNAESGNAAGDGGAIQVN
jgi:hypothetical protein